MGAFADDKINKILSFAGGLVVFSVIVGVIVNNNEHIRKEAEQQIYDFLNTSKNLLRHYEGVARRFSQIAGHTKNDNLNSNIMTESALALKTEADLAYDRLWERDDPETRTE